MKDKSLTYKLNLIRNNGNFFYNLNQFLLKNSGDGYESVLQIIKKREEGKLLMGNYKPSSYNELWEVSKQRIANLNLEKNLMWHLVVLKENISIVNHFLLNREKIEKLVLVGEFVSAKNELDALEEVCGVSFWSLEVRLLLDNLIGEQSIGEINNNNVQFLIDLFKIKLDDREQGSRYRKKIKDIIFRTVKSEHLKFYLLHKMGILEEINIDLVQGVLWYDSINSIVDVFCAVQFILLNYRDDLIRNKTLKNLVNSCFSLCTYKSIIRLFEEPQKDNRESNEIISLFEKKDFNAVVERFEEKKELFILNPHLIYLYDIALMAKGVNSEKIEETEKFSDKIIKRLFLYFSNDKKNGGKNSLEIETLCRIMSVFYFSGELKYLFSKFYSPIPLNKNSIMLNDKVVDIIESFSSSSNPMLNFYYRSTNDYNIEEISESLKEDKLTSSLELNKYIGMIEAYAKYYSFINENQFEEALKVLINEFVIRSESVGGLNIAPIYNWIDSTKYDSKVTVQRLIFINELDEFKDLRTSAFLNFLDYNKLSEPLDVLKVDSISKELKIYYLESVCNVENLAQIYYLFENADAVEDYRIEICKKLIELLVDEAKPLREEINQIYRNRRKRKKLTELEEAKLSVDFSAIRSSIKKEFSELFYLYEKTHQDEIEIRQGSDLLDTELQKLANLLGGNIQAVYVTKRSSIAKEMYELYLKEFCFGKNGLDIYLSTRIRHGTFFNQIFKIFQAHDITRERFIVGVQEETNKLLSIYAKLEEIINDVTQKKLKVNYEKAESFAMFNFYEDQLFFFESLSRAISKVCINEESCLESIEEVVIDKSSKILTSVKEDLLPSVKVELSNTLDELLVETKKILGSNNYILSLEKDINDCNLELKETFEKISAWFVIPKETTWPNISFIELIDLCKEIGKNLHYNFEKANLSYVEDEDYIFKGAYYNHLNDIFMILLNNAFMHSGYKNKNINLLNINIMLSSNNEEELKLVFKNNLNLNALNLGKIDNDIKSINEYYDKAIFSDYHLHKEGGTGLLRTINMLFSVLKIGNGFKVVRDGENFQVEITLKKLEVLNEQAIIN